MEPQFGLPEDQGVGAAMRRIILAASFYGIALASGLLVETPLVATLVVASAACLTAGYRFRLDLSLFAAGWLLYYPLSLVLWAGVGALDGFLVSATVVTVLSERLSFENDLSLVTEASTGVDGEALRLAGGLSSAHWKRLGGFALVTFAVASAAALLSRTTQAVTVLVSFSLILMFALYAYVRWG